MAEIIANGTAAGSGARVGSPDGDASRGYWAGAEIVVILLLAVVAVRVHEFFPALRVVKPVFSLSIVGLFLLASRSTVRARRQVFEHPLSRLVLAYMGAVLLTIPFALWKGAAIGVAKSMVPGVLLFAAFVLTAPSRKTLDRIQVAFVLLLLFFIVYVRTVGTAFTGRLRSVGLFSDPNDLASVIATAVPFAMAVVMRTHRPRDRAAAGLALVLLIVSLVATGSRGGTLALAAGATVFALGMRGERGFVMILLMVAGGVAAWSTAPASFKDRMLSLTSLETDYNTTSDSGRKAVWRRGRLYFRQNPILGVGAGNFATAEGAYKEETGGSGKWSAPHNAYVEAFAELGVVGGGTFVLLLLTAAKLSLPMWRPPSRRGRGPPALYRPEFLSSLAAFSTGAVFLSHAYFLPLFGVLGFIALADRTSRAEMQGGGELGAQPLATRARVRVPGQRGRLAFVRDYADLHAPATFGMGLELPAARRGGRGGTSAERE